MTHTSPNSTSHVTTLYSNTRCFTTLYSTFVQLDDHSKWPILCRVGR